MSHCACGRETPEYIPIIPLRTRAEVGAVLGCTAKTVARWQARGWLGYHVHVFHGRKYTVLVDNKQLEEFLITHYFQELNPVVRAWMERNRERGRQGREIRSRNAARHAA